MKKIYTTVILLSIIKIAIAQVTITGTIKDQNTLTGLIGANIIINNSEKGTATEENGHYAILVKRGNIQLDISYVGYKSQSLTLEITKDTTLNFFLENQSFNEVIITDNRSPIEKIGQTKMGIERMKLTPSILGETDPLKSLVFQPGISGGAEGVSAIHVRGGNADQNLLLLDGVRVYNQGHLLGFISVFNPSVVESANIIKGGFSAKYGGRLSSIIDVTTKLGDEEKTKSELSIGTISSHFYLQKKISPRLSMMIAGRLGNLAIYTLPLQIPIRNNNFLYTQRLGYWMYDTNFKLQYQIDKSSYLSFSTYHGKDFFYTFEMNGGIKGAPIFDKQTLGLNWGNNIASLKYHRSKSNQTTRIETALSSYGLNFSYEDIDFDNATYSSYRESLSQSRSLIRDYSLSVNHTIRQRTWLHTIGGEVIYHFFKPSSIFIEKRGQVVPPPYENQTYRTLETAMYYEAQYQPTEKIELVGGLRFSLNKGIDATFFNAEPRFSIAYKNTENSAFKISYSKMVQPMHLLSSSGAGFPTDVWIPISQYYRPQIAHQIDAGYHTSATVQSHSIQLGAEVFYKKMRHLVNFSNGAPPLIFNVTQNWSALLENEGQGYAYGAELSVAKETGPFKSWLAYTLMWSYRQFNELNNGNWFPHLFDRRHDFSWTSAYQWSKKWDVAANFVFSTGSPYTAYNTVMIDLQGNPVIFATEKHGERLPNYHRLDLVFNYKKIKKRSNRAVKWSFGVYNVYANRNVFLLEDRIDYLSDDDEALIFVYDFGGLAFLRAIPFVTYSIKF